MRRKGWKKRIKLTEQNKNKRTKKKKKLVHFVHTS